MIHVSSGSSPCRPQWQGRVRRMAGSACCTCSAGGGREMPHHATASNKHLASARHLVDSPDSGTELRAMFIVILGSPLAGGAGRIAERSGDQATDDGTVMPSAQSHGDQLTSVPRGSSG
jgi:hypothetical protein